MCLEKYTWTLEDFETNVIQTLQVCFLPICFCIGLWKVVCCHTKNQNLIFTFENLIHISLQKFKVSNQQKAVRPHIYSKSKVWDIMLSLLYPPQQNLGAIMDSLCRVRRSVGLSVRPSFRLHFRVRSINPKQIEVFSSNFAQMFTSTRGCAEPMLPICQLKVKDTIEVQKSNSHI
jgi:hypothetical protein